MAQAPRNLDVCSTVLIQQVEPSSLCPFRRLLRTTKARVEAILGSRDHKNQSLNDYQIPPNAGKDFYILLLGDMRRIASTTHGWTALAYMDVLALYTSELWYRR